MAIGMVDGRAACAICGTEVGHREAEAMTILIAGTFLCDSDGAPTGGTGDNRVAYPGYLTHT